MLVSLIAAVSDNGVIGLGGRIPWRLPRDVRHFRSYTAGKWVLVGRTTYKEMSGWFTDHKSIILTRDRDYRPKLGVATHTVKDALRIAKEAGAAELVVLGGGEVFAAVLPFADMMILTLVHTTIGAGVRFPRYAPEEWMEESREEFPPDAENPHAMEIVRLRRRKAR